MKTNELMPALLLAKPALGGADSLSPILSHFCFVDGLVYAYNGIAGVMIEADHNLECALHGDTLLNILEASGAEEVTVAAGDEPGLFQIDTPGGWVKIPSLDVATSTFEPPDEQPIITVPITDEFLNGIERCLISVGSDSVKPEFSGITVQVAGGKLELFSTDNRTASRFTFSGKIVGRKTVAVVVPEQTCGLIGKLAAACGAQDDGTYGKLAIGEKAAILTFAGATVVSKMLPAKPEVFAAVFGKHAEDTDLSTIPEEVKREITKAAVLLGKEQVKDAHLTFSKGRVEVAATGSLGAMHTTVTSANKTAAKVCVDPTLVLRMFPMTDMWGANNEESLVMASGDQFVHIIAAVAGRDN